MGQLAEIDIGDGGPTGVSAVKGARGWYRLDEIGSGRCWFTAQVSAVRPLRLVPQDELVPTATQWGLRSVSGHIVAPFADQAQAARAALSGDRVVFRRVSDWQDAPIWPATAEPPSTSKGELLTAERWADRWADLAEVMLCGHRARYPWQVLAETCQERAESAAEPSVGTGTPAEAVSGGSDGAGRQEDREQLALAISRREVARLQDRNADLPDDRRGSEECMVIDHPPCTVDNCATPTPDGGQR